MLIYWNAVCSFLLVAVFICDHAFSHRESETKLRRTRGCFGCGAHSVTSTLTMVFTISLRKCLSALEYVVRRNEHFPCSHVPSHFLRFHVSASCHHGWRVWGQLSVSSCAETCEATVGHIISVLCHQQQVDMEACPYWELCEWCSLCDTEVHADMLQAAESWASLKIHQWDI